MRRLFIFSLLILALTNCKNKQIDQLPILGRYEIVETAPGADTLYHTIKDFSFIDQDSVIVTNETFANSIYVSDFFFTSCPSICPVMKAQLLRVYEAYENNANVKLLSHTIDPEYDNVTRLHDYANRLDVLSSKWHFVTGEKAKIYEMAQTSYYVATRENEKAPGGYEHSGAFILVDAQRHIRGVYQGTDPKAVDKLINDIAILLRELEN